MQFAQKVFDPETKETFRMDPKSLENSYMVMGAEGYVLTKNRKGVVAWRKRRKKWRMLNTFKQASIHGKKKARGPK